MEISKLRADTLGQLGRHPCWGKIGELSEIKEDKVREELDASHHGGCVRRTMETARVRVYAHEKLGNTTG